MRKIFLVSFWIIVLVVLTHLFGEWERMQMHPNDAVKAQITPMGEHQIVLRANQDGHYLVLGTLNGQAVEFMLDTGASHVSIPLNTAKRLKLKQGMPLQAITANGTVNVYNTHIKEIRIGNIVLHDLVADIDPGLPNDLVLLGMNALKKLEIIQKDDQLILRQ